MHAFFGILIITVAAASAASFYVPLQKVKNWGWESYYLAQGVIAWIVAPLTAAMLTIPDLATVYANSPPEVLAMTAGLGVLWGVGALTFGLSVRYLGLSLGYAIPLGTCAAVGTLAPSVIEGKFLGLFLDWHKALILVGVGVTLAGIGICGWAGTRKERELTHDEKKQSVQEPRFIRGLFVSLISGTMAACFAIGLTTGQPIADVAKQYGADELYANNAIFFVITFAGFFTNLAWCLFLGFKNKTLGDYVSGPAAAQARNYFLVILAGTLWYVQFFFYGMGYVKMGEYDFTAWSILMALIIAMSNLWGIAMKEWKGTSPGTRAILWAGIAVLVFAVIIIGLGNYLPISEQ